MKYIATNYAMGRTMAATMFEAKSHDEAVRIATAKLGGQKNALGDGGHKVACVGVKGVK